VRKRWLRTTIVAFLVLVAIVACRYVYARFMSGVNAISVESRRAAAYGGDRPTSIRVATWNIAHGRGPELDAANYGCETPERRERLEAMGRLLESEGAEIVVLNEVDFSCFWSGHVDQAAIIAEAGSYPYIVRQRNIDFAVPFAKWQFGNAILSRHPINEARLEQLPPRSQFEKLVAGNHDSALVKIELPGGAIIAVWAVHLDYRDESTRIRAARAIVDRAIKIQEPLFLMGDFNSSPQYLGRRGRGTAQAGTAFDVVAGLGMFGFYPALDSTTGTFPSKGATRTIDWIAFPSDWSVSRGSIGDSAFSDHRPVFAEIGLPQPQRP
jgi:endonuclease/exonuclease/phosphatase family metal-dependent hydrolase